MSFYDASDYTSSKPTYVVIKQNLTTLLNEELKTIKHTSRLQTELDLKPSQAYELADKGVLDVDGYRYLLTIIGYS